MIQSKRIDTLIEVLIGVLYIREQIHSTHQQTEAN